MILVRQPHEHAIPDEKDFKSSKVRDIPYNSSRFIEFVLDRGSKTGKVPTGSRHQPTPHGLVPGTHCKACDAQLGDSPVDPELCSVCVSAVVEVFYPKVEEVE